MIAREEARLHAIFHRLLLLTAAASSVTTVACSTSGGATPDDGGASSVADTGAGEEDATVSTDSAAPDAGSVAIDGSDLGYDDAACYPQLLDAGPDSDGCQFFKALPCGLPPDAATEACNLLLEDCQRLCGDSVQRPCAITECMKEEAGAAATIPPGAITLECATGEIGCAPGVGRRPAGLAPCEADGASSATGAWLASMAHLEAASVHAFRDLRAELVALGAPSALVHAASRAAEDEARHARVASRLARRRGAVPPRVRVNAASVARGARRSLASLAVENAIEGCVRESFGALVAARQASRAEDPEVARAMRRIARDETRHAALAWALARWLAPRLDHEGRAAVARAARAALATLRCEASSVDPGAARELGLPAGAEGAALVDSFAAAAFA